jgi:hypothetical protein
MFSVGGVACEPTIFYLLDALVGIAHGWKFVSQHAKNIQPGFVKFVDLPGCDHRPAAGPVDIVRQSNPGQHWVPGAPTLRDLWQRIDQAFFFSRR